MLRSSLAALLLLALLGCKHGTAPADGDEVPPYPFASHAWRAKLRERLRGTRVTQAYEGIPLEQVLHDLDRRSGVNIRLDQTLLEKPKVDLQVIHVRLRDCPADQALDAVLSPLGLAWALREEMVYVARPEQLPAAPPGEDVAERIVTAKAEAAAYDQRKATQARLAGMTITVEYADMPLESVVDDLAERGKVPIRFERAELVPPKGSRGVKISPHDVHFASVLGMVLEERGLGFRWRGAEIRVVTMAEALEALKVEQTDAVVRQKKVTLDASGVRLRELAGLLRQAAQIDVLLDEATWKRQEKVTLKCADLELKDVLLKIKDDARCSNVLLDGTVYFLSKEE